MSRYSTDIANRLHPTVGLRCLPPWFKREMADWAAHLTADQTASYLDRLEFLANHIEPLTIPSHEEFEPAFASLCSKAVEGGPEGTADALNLEAAPDVDAKKWFVTANRPDIEASARMYFLAGFFGGRDDTWLDRGDSHAIAVIRVMEQFRLLQRPAAAVRACEDYLRLTGAEYDNPHRLAAALGRSVDRIPRNPKAAIHMLSLTAAAMSYTPGRGPAAAGQLLRAWPAGEADTRASIVRHLAQILEATARTQDDGIAVLEAWLGLSPCDYHNAEDLAEKLDRSPLSRISLGRQAEIIAVLAHMLPQSEKHGPLCAVSLIYVWLNSISSASREIAFSPDKNLLRGLRLDQQFGVIAALADGLSLVGRSRAAEALEVLESWSDLRAEDFVDPARLAARLFTLPPLGSLSATNQAAFVLVLAGILMNSTSRGPTAATALLESWLGLSASDYENPNALAARLNDDRVKSLAATSRAGLLIRLAEALAAVPGRSHQAALALLDAWLGLAPADYEDPEQFRQALDRSDLGRLDISNRANAVSTLIYSVRFATTAGERLAVTAGEAWLGLRAEDFMTVERLREALERGPFGEDSAAASRVVFAVAECLSFLEERGEEHPIGLMAAALGLSHNDAFEDAGRLRNLISQGRFSRVDPVARASGVRTLADALHWSSRHGPGATIAVLEAYLGLDSTDYADAARLASDLAAGPLVDLPEIDQSALVAALANALIADGRRGPVPASMLLMHWAGIVSADWTSMAKLNVALARGPLGRVPHENRAGLVSLLGRALALSSNSDADRAVRLLEAWLGAPARQARDAPSFREATLANRLSFLRSWLRAAGPEHMDTVAVCEEAVAEVSAVRADLRYPERRDLVELIRGLWAELVFVVLSRADGSRRGEDSITADKLELQMLGWMELVENRLIVEETLAGHGQSYGVTDALRRDSSNAPPSLADLVPQGVVWIRTLFEEDGRLRWWAVWLRNGFPEILARGVGNNGAQRRLEAATLSFDLEVERIWAQFEGHRVDMRTRATLNLAVVQDSEGDGALTLLGRTHPLLATLGVGVFRGVRERNPPEESILAIWSEQVSRLGEVWEGDATSPARDARRRAELDAASRRLLATVQSEFDLDPLAEAAGRVGMTLEEVDVMWQVQGPLLVAPLAWLKLGADPLYQRVASTGSVVSLTLRAIGQSVDAVPVSRHLVAAYWLPIGAPQWSTFRHMAAELRAIGERHCWSVEQLSDHPAAIATVAALCSSLTRPERPAGVCIVAGHGDLRRAGVRLADDVWCGEGAALRQVNWLILSACAVGRLDQLGDRDARGMYVRLATNGCRSVLAARWPIGDAETTAWTAAVLSEYLNRDGIEGAEQFPRARAVNRARIRLLGTKHASVSFHHVSSFELYGIG